MAPTTQPSPRKKKKINVLKIAKKASQEYRKTVKVAKNLQSDVMSGNLVGAYKDLKYL